MDPRLVTPSRVFVFLELAGHDRWRVFYESESWVIISGYQWVPLLLCLVAAVWDLRTREIPDTIPLVLILGRLALLPIGGGVWWHHLAGGIAAFILAAVASRGGGFGGGDVKLFAALGAWFGVFAVVPLGMWVALAGLPLALIAALRKLDDFAYGPAILGGVCVYVWDPNLLERIAGL